MKRILTIIYTIVSFSVGAQDIHFTMWDAMPLTTNPAAAGVFNGDIRGVINYRSQWGSIGNPYRTYGVMLDGGLYKKKWKNGYLGAGLNMYKDVAGATEFGTTKISLSLSSVLYLDDKNSAAVGVTGAWAQNSMNSDNLQWDSQFNGQSFDASSNSNESISFEGSSYIDFSVGALWAYGTGSKTLSSQDEFAMKAGLAYYHVTQPSRDVSFGDLDELYAKWAFHAESYIGVSNTDLSFKPKFITYIQGPAQQYTAGLLLRYLLVQESKYTGIFKEMAIAFGGYYRVGDAFSPSVEFEMSGLAIGFAYDMNFSGLTAATAGNGGPEIFIRFQNPSFVYGRGTRSSARFR